MCLQEIHRPRGSGRRRRPMTRPARWSR